MNKLLLLFIIALTFFLTSCAAPADKKIEPKENALKSEQPVASPSREALYVYGEETNEPDKIILTLGGEPALTATGYLRLTGIINPDDDQPATEKPTVCLEVEGRGVPLSEGEKVGSYQLILIKEKEITLIKSKEKHPGAKR